MFSALFSIFLQPAVAQSSLNGFSDVPVGQVSEVVDQRSIKYGKISWIKVTGSDDFSGEILGCNGPEEDTLCKFKIVFRPTKPGLQKAQVQLHFDFGSYPDDHIWEISGVGVELKPPVAEMCHPGSIIHLESGVLREEIPVVGVPFSLFYSSSLAETFKPNYVKFAGHVSYNPDTLLPSIHHFLDFNGSKVYLGDGTSVGVKVVPLRDGTYFVDGVRDRSEAYIFNKAGVHLGTKSRMLGAWLYQFKYDSSGKLSQIIYGAEKLTINFNRDTDGNLIGIVGAFGQRTAIESSGKFVKKVENPAGEIYVLSYQDGGLLQEFINPMGQSSKFFYSENGLLIADINSGGNFTKIERTFSGAESLIEYTSALGEKSFIKGGPAVLNGKNVYQSVAKDPLQFSKVVTQYGTSVKTDYDGSTYVVDSSEDPRTKGMRMSWSAQVHDGAGWYSIGKWFNSEPKVVTDPYSYSTTRTVIYESFNNKTTELGSAVFDFKRRTLTNASKEGVRIITTYDSFERPVSVKRGDDVATEFIYDEVGRMMSLNKEGRQLLKFGYDQHNNISEIENPSGAKKSFVYDAANRIIKIKQQDDSSVSFEYDKVGNLKAVIPENKERYEFVQNEMGLVSKILPPLFNSATPSAIQYEYDLEKKIKKIIRPNSAVIDFSYDKAGKLLTASTSEGVYENVFFSDSPSLLMSRTPYGVLQTMSYLGTLVKEKQQNISGLSDLTVKYLYDERYRVKRFESIIGTDAGGYNVSYNFDSKIVKAGDEILTWGVPSGRLLKRQLGNLLELRKYDDFGELKSLEVQIVVKNPKTIFSSNLKRDQLGRIISKEDIVNGLKESYSYTYDVTGRLVQTKKDGQVYSSYVYDSNGNRIKGIHAKNEFNALYDQEDRMVALNSDRYSYDGEGNVTKVSSVSGETKLRYTSFGKLSQISGPNGVIDYKIDPSGIPVLRQEGAGYQMSIFFGTSRLAAIVDEKSNVTRFVHASGITTPDYLVKNSERYFIVQDHLGSPRLVIDVKTGRVVQELSYSDLGLVTKNTNPGFQPFGYAGGFLDQTSGLVRFGARYYDPRIGRWISKDPVLFLGGSSNLYGYVSNDPINLIDPTGLVDLMMCGDGPCSGGLRDQYMSATAMSIEQAKKNDAFISGATLVAAGIVLAAPMVVDTAVIVGGVAADACLVDLVGCSQVGIGLTGGIIKKYLDEPDTTPAISIEDFISGAVGEYLGGCLKK